MTNKELESRVNGLEAQIGELGEKLAQAIILIQQQDEKIAAIAAAGSPVQTSVKGGGKVGVTYILHSVPTEGIQPQARKCMKLAADHFGLEVEIEERDLIAFLRGKQAEISANQDAWSKVFGFYRLRLVEMGALTWNK